MDWGFVERYKNTKISKNDLGLLYIKHFWKKVIRIFTNDIVEEMQVFFNDHPEQKEKFNQFFEETNTVCKQYFLGEKRF